MNYDLSFTVGVDTMALHGFVILRARVNFASQPHLLIVAPSGSG